jgi:hypothetical protein
LLAGLALLGLGPSVALAQQTTTGGYHRLTSHAGEIGVPADPVSDWISLKDNADVSTARLSDSAALSGAAMSGSACTSCAGAGCGACDSCCDPCGGMGGLRRWSDPSLRGGWINVDYLLWSVGGYDLPPLVTAAPNGVIPNLGNPGVVVLVGNDELDDDLRSGGRLRMGTWLDNTQTAGAEGHFFGFESVQSHLNFAQAGAGAFSLGRPYIEVAPNFPIPGVGPGEAALLAAFDDPVLGVVSNGRVDVDTSSNIYSAGALARHFLAEQGGARVDALGGFRFFRFDEGLFVQSTSIAGPGAPFPIPIGFTRRVTDTFDCVNEFYGAEFGMNVERDFGDLLSVEFIPKLALGNVYQRVDLEGSKSFEFPGLAPDIRPGGLLVQPSNTGTPLSRASFDRDEFAFLAEVNINAGVQLTRQVRATVGWTSIYLSEAARPGQQIDRSVNGNQLIDAPIVGPVRPLFSLDSSDLWLYGMNFGIEGTY